MFSERNLVPICHHGVLTFGKVYAILTKKISSNYMHAESFSLEIFTNYVALYSFSVHAVWVNPPPKFFWHFFRNGWEFLVLLYVSIYAGLHFYRAMHFSAYARSWDRMSSVCLSVTLVICDHIGWKSWKLTARTISHTPSLFVAKRRSTYSKGNMGKFWGD